MAVICPTQPELHVDLDALRANFCWFASQSSNAETGAAVKANAYGLGLHLVAPALMEAGCTTFFVAHLDEAVALRQILAANGIIYVLHGPTSEQVDDFITHDLRPVLNTMQQVSLWQKQAASKAVAVHVDTGINRLGLSLLEAELPGVQNLNLSLLMSHLACASNPAHSHNQMQLEAFCALIDLFPAIPASLSNSAGILLGPEYHFNLTRPGIGLYGGSPFDPEMDPPKLSPVARLLAPILQIRRLQKGQQVGYGARFSAPTDMQIATIAYGYADGLSRTIGANSFGWIDGQKLPLLGRVSMDLMAVDISQLAKCPKPGDFVQFFGDDLNDFASSCATEPYEILTSIGPRVKRVAQEQNK